MLKHAGNDAWRQVVRAPARHARELAARTLASLPIEEEEETDGEKNVKEQVVDDDDDDSSDDEARREKANNSLQQQQSSNNEPNAGEENKATRAAWRQLQVSGILIIFKNIDDR